MSNGSELKSKAAKALRAAGFKPLPRWWVTEEQLDLIAWMAHQNADVVNAIRAEANRTSDEEYLSKQAQIEAAWNANGQKNGRPN